MQYAIYVDKKSKKYMKLIYLIHWNNERMELKILECYPVLA